MDMDNGNRMWALAGVAFAKSHLQAETYRNPGHYSGPRVAGPHRSIFLSPSELHPHPNVLCNPGLVDVVHRA